jgi:hypothetical protein
MTRWEYTFIMKRSLEGLADALSALGQEGWEAIGIAVDSSLVPLPVYVVLKRPA